MTDAPSQRRKATVFVVEDHAEVREALLDLFTSIGLNVCSFETAEAFLDDRHSAVPGCLVVDIRLPGKSGLDLYDEMTRLGDGRPVIFISGHADVALSVRAMKAGAMEFLTKPVRDQDLLDAVRRAIEEDVLRRTNVELIARIDGRMKKLTPREVDILRLVTEGLRNKDIAVQIGVAEATVKLHRAHVMQKMEARSLAELVRMTDFVSARRVPESLHQSLCACDLVATRRHI